MPFLAALPALASAGASLYSAIKGAKKEKEATKQSATAQRLAKEADANAVRIAREGQGMANQRYQALDPFRNAAFAELTRAGGITPDKYAAITGGKYSGRTDEALDAATRGLDRTALTRQAMADYDAANERGLRDRFRAVGSNAAKFGRLGMQVNEQNVRDVEREYEGDRQRNANELIRNATEATVGDRYRALDATSGLNAQDIGLQERNRGFDYGTRRDAVGDRSNAIQTAQGLAGTGFDNSQLLSTNRDLSGASQNVNTRGALGDAAAINRQSADQYGRGAVDAAGAAGRFLALPRTNAPLAVDPSVMRAAATIPFKGLTPEQLRGF